MFVLCSFFSFLFIQLLVYFNNCQRDIQNSREKNTKKYSYNQTETHVEIKTRLYLFNTFAFMKDGLRNFSKWNFLQL